MASRRRRKHPRRRGRVTRTVPSPHPASSLATIPARENLLAHLALLAMVLVAYSPAFFAGFVWDDEIFTDAEVVLEWSGLSRLWFEPSSLTREAHYWPLVYSTFWLEHKLWGFDPLGYHVVNVALHGVNTLLMWRILTRLEVPGSWLVAALFAAHPMQAEAVTWIMGRKDLLSTLFYLAAAGCWLRFRERPRIGTQVLLRLLFAAGMLTQSMVVTLPAALLLCVWWKHGRISRSDLIQVAPLFAVGFGIAAVDLIHYSSRTDLDFDYSWLERLLIASRAIWFYALKPFWPYPLPVIYEYWDSSPDNPLNWLCLLAVVAVGGTLWLLRNRTGRGPLAGALFFAITLSPVLGFTNNSYLEFSFVADRYQYLAGVGIKAVLAGTLMHLLWQKSRISVHFVSALLLVACTGLAMRHANLFRSEISLFSHIVSYNSVSASAHYNLGRAMEIEGQSEEGLEALLRSLELDPEYDKAYGGIGWALFNRQRFAEAEEYLRKAAEANPSDQEALQNLAESLRAQGRPAEALDWYDAVVQLNNRFVHAYLGKAMSLGELGRNDEASDNFERALELNPNDHKAYGGLGWLLLNQKRYEESERNFRRAVELHPTDRQALQNLAESIRAQGRFEEALRWYDAVVGLDENDASALAGRAMMLGELGRDEEARDSFERALAVNPELEARLSGLPLFRRIMGLEIP